MNTLRAAPAIIAAALAAQAPARAQPSSPETRPVVAIDDRLTEHRIGSFAFDHALGIPALDADTIGLATGWIAAFASPATSPASGAPAPMTRSGESGGVFIVGLTDGQRLPALVLPSEDPEAVSLDLIALNEVRLPIENVRSLRAIDRPPTIEPGRLDDVVLLRNGDRLTGFVVSLGRTIVIETDAGERAVPIESVAEATLANDPVRNASPLVWLSNGSVIAARAINRTGTDRFELLPAEPLGERAGSWNVDRRDLHAVLFEPGRWMALGAIEPSSRRAVGGRRWLPPVGAGDPSRALLGAPDLTLDGPIELAWELPAEAAWFSTRVELPESARVWGDFELVVELRDSAGRTELERVRVFGDRPTVTIVTPLEADPGAARGSLGGPTLILRLEPGARGPIEDRAVLVRPVVLLDAAPAQ